MPSLIPNYIARLRTHSQSTATSSSSQSQSGSYSTPGPSTPAPAHAPLAAQSGPQDPSAASERAQPGSPEIGQKIHPDLDALLVEARVNTSEEPGISIDDASMVARGKQSTGEVVSLDDGTRGPARVREEGASASPRSPLLSRILSGSRTGASKPHSILQGVEGDDLVPRGALDSTFGRRPNFSQRLGLGGITDRSSARSSMRSGQRSGVASVAGSSSNSPEGPTTPTEVSASRTRSSRPPSSRSLRPSTTPSRRSTTEGRIAPDSPTGTVSSSSKSHSAHSQSVRSKRAPLIQLQHSTGADLAPARKLESPYTPFTRPQGPQLASAATPSTIPANSPPSISPQFMRGTLDDTPQTFGRVTPRSPVSLKGHRHQISETFSPDSVAAPQHPREYAAPTGAQHYTREHRQLGHDRIPSTFPKRSPSKFSSSVSFPSLPFSRSRSRSTSQLQSSRTHAGDVFAETAERRTSADWCSQEAARQQSSEWPAVISREIVRLSLQDKERPRMPATRSESAASVDTGAPVDAHLDVARNPGLFGSIGADRLAFMRRGNVPPSRRGALPESMVGSDRLATAASAPEPSLAGNNQFPIDTEPELQHSVTIGNDEPLGSVARKFSPLAPVLLGPALAISPLNRAGSGASSSNNELSDPQATNPHLSVTAPTPSASPGRPAVVSDPGPSVPSSRAGTPVRGKSISAGAAMHLGGRLSGEEQYLGPGTVSSGKRKTTFADQSEPNSGDELSRKGGANSGRAELPRGHHPSDASHAPSSYKPSNHRGSRPSSVSPAPRQPYGASPPGSPTSRPPSSLRTARTTDSRRSIPVRAIVAPRPPSVMSRSSYLMRDPELPPSRRHSTTWAGGARRRDDHGANVFPIQGWAFVIGFIIFPLWWLAAILPLNWTSRSRGASDAQDGKGAWHEDDQIATKHFHQEVALVWRRRCRFMSIVALFIYIPLVVLLAVLIPRSRH